MKKLLSLFFSFLCLFTVSLISNAADVNPKEVTQSTNLQEEPARNDEAKTTTEKKKCDKTDSATLSKHFYGWKEVFRHPFKIAFTGFFWSLIGLLVPGPAASLGLIFGLVFTAMDLYADGCQNAPV